MKLRFHARTRRGWAVTIGPSVVAIIAPFGGQYELAVVGRDFVPHRLLYMGQTIGFESDLCAARGKVIEHFTVGGKSLLGGAT